MLKRERQVLSSANRIYKSRAKKHDEIVGLALDELLSLGGLFVKFAQMLLLNPSFAKSIPKEKHRQIFDRVGIYRSEGLESYLPPAQVVKLRQSLVNISDKPVYSGSFAVVYDALLVDGTKVIIKVLRPDIRRSLKQDMRLLVVITKSIGLFSDELDSVLKNAVKEFRASVLRETNYVAEIANTNSVKSSLGNTNLIIPCVYNDLSSSVCIVQEKLEGVWLSEILGLGLKSHEAAKYVKGRVGSDMEHQLYDLEKTMLINTLTGIYAHGDPHPGNVVLMRDNKVGLIDFGSLAPPIKGRLALLEYIKEQVKNLDGDIDIARLIICILRFHANYLYRAIVSLSTIYNRPLLEELYSLLKSEVAAQQAIIDLPNFRQEEFGRSMSGDINKNNRFGLVPNIDSPITQKAFVVYWRTNDELGMKKITRKVFVDVVNNIESAYDLSDWKEEKMSPDFALQIISEWLTFVSEKDPKLFLSLSSLFKQNNHTI